MTVLLYTSLTIIFTWTPWKNRVLWKETLTTVLWTQEFLSWLKRWRSISTNWSYFVNRANQDWKHADKSFQSISSVYTANWLKVRGQSVLHFSEAIHRGYRSKGLGQKEQRKRNDTSSYICNSQILSYLKVKCPARCTVVYGSSLTARIFT